MPEQVPPAFPRSLFFLGLVMVILAALELAILYRYLGARDRMLGEAEYFSSGLVDEPTEEPTGEGLE